METAGGRDVVVAGASGFVGHAAVRQLAQSGWNVTGLSRTHPASAIEGVRYLQTDLRDADACRAAAASMQGATHLVYAAVNETPGDLVASWSDPDHAARNGAMFENILDALLLAAPRLQQVILIHGTKAYGPHVPGWHLPVPLREALPRPPIDDFYFRQEDHLWAQARNGLRWTILRCPMIAGGGPGGNLNALLAIAVLASIRREEGLDLPFPGALDNRGVMEMIDVEVLGRAIAWAATADAAANQTFNIANGDVYVWPDLWPLIAAEFAMVPGGQEPFSVRAYIEDRAHIWADLCHRHDLAAPSDVMAFLGESGALADFALGNCNRSVLTSTVKLRKAGFTETVDTAERLSHWIAQWRADRLLPP